MSTRPTAARIAASVLTRLVLLGATWWALVEGDTSVVTYGLVAVPLAVAVSYVATGAPGPRPAVTPRRLVLGAGFVVWFLGQALSGGVDVARRALGRRVDVAPYWGTYETTLPGEDAAVALALLMNLMPGTLSANLHDGSVIEIHAISPDIGVEEGIRALERRLAALLAG